MHLVGISKQYFTNKLLIANNILRLLFEFNNLTLCTTVLFLCLILSYANTNKNYF